jgi:IS30 family transposase
MKLAAGKGRPPSLSDKMVELVKELFEDGYSPLRIAAYLKAHHGVITTDTTVYRELDKAGLRAPKTYTYSGSPPNEYRSRAASLRWGSQGFSQEGPAPAAPTYG